MQNDGFIISNNDDNKFDSINCYNRTINNKFDELRNSGGVTGSISNFNENRDDDDINININIYRYKFSSDFIIELSNFAKIHQYDHRKVFKEAWEVWIEENDKIISNEIIRLTELGYDGNILNKMFKSARYYFRKKSTEKKTLKKRREYTSVLKELLISMDKHISSGINQLDYKPSAGFEEFCKNHMDLLREQVNNFCKNGFTDHVEIKAKIKKTYKNRYFLQVKQIL